MLTTTEAQLLARMTFKMHGMRNLKLSFSGLTKDGRIGEFDSNNQKIILSKKVLASAKLFDTVLKHEMAHAMQFAELGGYDGDQQDPFHGPTFKKYARSLGVPPCPFVDSILFHS